MTRRCKQCKEVELKPARQCTDIVMKKGFCSIECAASWGLSKAKAKSKKQAIAKHRQDKERIKSKADLVKEAQKEFNLFVRMRDYHLPCISCGKSKLQVEQELGHRTGGAWDAGHFRSRGAAKQLRFNLYNCHKQCKSCNGGEGKFGMFNNKSDTINKQYESNLIDKIGAERVEALKNDASLECDTPDKLRRIKRIFAKRARIYKKIIESTCNI